MKKITAQQASKLLGVSEKDIKILEEQGVLHSVQPHGKESEYDQTEIERIQHHHENTIAEEAQVVNIELEREVISSVKIFRRVIVVIGICLAAYIVLILLFTLLYIFKPTETANIVGLTKNNKSAILSHVRNPSNVLGASTSREQEAQIRNFSPLQTLLLPVTSVSLSMVKTLRPQSYAEVAKVAIVDINDVIGLDDSGSLTPVRPLSLLNSSMLKIGSKDVVTNLNSEYLQGRKPGANPGDLAIVGQQSQNEPTEDNEPVSIVALTNANLSGNANISNTNLANSSITVSTEGKLIGGGTVELGGVLTLSCPTCVDGSGFLTASSTETITNKTIPADKNTISGLTNANLSGNAGITDVNLAAITASGKVAGSAVQLSSTGGLTNNNGLSLMTTCSNGQLLGWNSTSSAWECTSAGAGTGDITGVTAGNGLSGGGTSGDVTLSVNPHTGGGVVVSSSGISLLRTCGSGELLKWNTSVTAWECATDGGGSSGISSIEEGDASIVSSATALDFLAADFIVTNSPSGEGNIAIDYSNAGITRRAQNESISGLWSFTNGLTVSGGTVSLPAGQIDNTELANASLTVTAGTGLTGGGAVSLGNSITLNAALGTDIINAEIVADTIDFTAIADALTLDAATTITAGSALNLTIGNNVSLVPSGTGSITANALASGTYGISVSGNAATVTNGLYTTTTFGGDASGTYNALVVADDSHNHSTTTISGLDISDDTNLSASDGITLTGDALTNTDKGSSQNIFKTIAIAGQSDVVTDANSDTVTFVAGSNVTLTTNASTDTITIAATDTNTTYSAGNDLDLTGTTFDLESVIDTVSTINLTGTGTLNGLDAIDGTSESTIENAIDTLGNLTAASSLATVGTLTSGATGTGFTINFGASTLSGSIGGSNIDESSLAGLSASNFTSQAISQWTNDAGYITDGNTNWDNSYGFITASSTNTLTNKSGNISQWTNDSGYLTSVDVSGNTNLSATDGITLTGDQLSLSATTGGAGLTYTTGVLAVGAGAGITVSADSISATLGTSIANGEIDDDTIGLDKVADALTYDANLTLLSDNATNDFKLILDNSSTGDIAELFEITTSGAGATIGTALDLADADIAVALAIGANDVTVNGITLTATEFSRLDGVDTTLIDTNDAVATAITGTGTLSSGAISSGFGAIDIGTDTFTAGAGSLTSLNLNNGLVTNIGDANTDFTSGGGLTLAGTFDANGQVDLGDGGETVMVNGSALTLQTTGAGSDITLNAVDQVILTDFVTCSALETVGGVLTCGSDDSGAGSLTVRETDGTPSVSTTTMLEFGPGTTSSDEFIVTDQTGGVARVQIGNQVAMLNQAETVTGGWTFGTAATTFTSEFIADGNITLNDSSADTILIGQSGTTDDTVTIAGNLSLTDDQWSISATGVAAGISGTNTGLISGDVSCTGCLGTTEITGLDISDDTNLSASDGITLTGDALTNTDKGSSQNIFKTITVAGQSDVVTDANADVLTLVAGSNVILTTTAGTDTITIAATDTDTTYAAGSDLDLTGTTFDIEPILDTVTTINLSGTGTLNGLDAIDATSESTIESAIDTLANLTAATSLASVGTLTTGATGTGFTVNFGASTLSGNITGSNIDESTLAGIADGSVSDALTISGGTIDNSVIGGTTPAAATFTTVTANGSTTLGDGTGNDSITIRRNGTGNVTFTGFTTCTALETDASGNLTCGTDDGGTSYSAGNDLDLTGSTFDLEPVLDFVTTINLSGTGTINGLDAIDATSESTIESAIDSLANLTTLTIGGDTITEFVGTGLLLSGNTLTASLGTSIANTEIDDDTLALDKIADVLTYDANLTLTSDNATTDYKLVLDNSSTGDIAELFEITTSGTGATISTALDLADADISTALALGANDITVNGITLTASEFARLDGIDTALIDTNDAVATAITGTGTLTAGSTGTGFTLNFTNSTLSGNITGTNISGLDISDDTNLSASDGITLTGDALTNTDKGSSQNIFKTIAIAGQSDVVSDANSDTLTLAAGSNVTLTTNAGTDTITITATDTNTTYSAGNDLDLTGTTFDLEATLDVVSTINLTGTGTINGLDVIDATSESTIESAIDSLANLTTLTIGGDTITEFVGTGLTLSGSTLTTSLGTNITPDELDVQGTATDEFCLTRETTAGAPFEWQSCGGGGGLSTIRESDGSPSVGSVSTLEFGPGTTSTDEFIVTDQTGGVVRVQIGNQVAMLNQAETVTGGWTFNTGTTTFTTALAANGGITFDNATDTLGAFTFGGTVDANGNIISNVGSTGTDFDTTGALAIQLDGIDADGALSVDNATNASSIFVAEDNGTPVFTIADGGIITATNNINADGGLDIDDAFIVANGGSITTMSIGDTDIPLTGAGLTFDFNNASDRTLTITNAGAGLGHLAIEGDLAINGGNITTGLTLDSTLTVAGALTANGAITLGDGGDTLAINTSDWDIDATGAMTGLAFDANGAGNSITNIETADIANGTLDADDLDQATADGAPADEECLTFETSGGGDFEWQTCGGGGGSNFDAIGDPAGNGAIAMAETTQTLDWNTAATAGGFDGLSITVTNDATTDATTQNGLRIDNLNDGGSTGTTESLLVIDNSDTNEAVTNGIEFVDAGGGFTNLFNVAGTGISATEFTRLDGKDAALVDQNDFTSGDGAGGTSSGSGLEAGTGGIGLLQGCSDNQVLQWNESSAVWECGTVGDAKAEAFTSSGTYTVPADAIAVIVDAWGGGGGGGGGAGGSTAAVRSGGAGGGGGAYSTNMYDASTIGASAAVTIGAAGSAGTGGVGASGTDGGVGGNTCFSSSSSCGGTIYLRSYGGAGGNGDGTAGSGGGGGGGTGSAGTTNGTAATGGTGGGPLGAGVGAANSGDGGGGGATAATTAANGGVSNFGGAGGGASTTTGANNSGAGGSAIKGGAGGGGGGTTAITTCVARNGGAGGTVPSGTAGGGGTAGTAGGAGGAGNSGANSSGGDGGGGGANTCTNGATAGAGGAGGARGGAGGGGGASAGTGTQTGGAGGAGGAGFVRVWTIKGSGADLAEIYGTTDSSIEAGDIVSLDSQLNAGVKKSAKSYDSTVLGVISTSPGMVIGSVEDSNARPVMVALSGRVPVKVSTENGSIKPGDLLTSSKTPGVAMKATKAGQIIGQAMTGYDKNEIGKILVFVKNDFSQGEGTAELLTGLNEDSATDGDAGKFILSKLVDQKEQLVEEVDMSEIVTDRVVAGLEVITPRIVADEIVARSIKADRIEGLEFIQTGFAEQDGRISTLEGLIAALPSQGASGSARIADTREASAAASLDNAILSSLFVGGLATVSGQLTAENIRVKDSLLVEAIANIADTLTAARIIINDTATFFGKAFFKDDVQIDGKLVVGKDTAGEATIKKGTDTVAVRFSKPYEQKPIVTASMIVDEGMNEVTAQLLSSDVKYLITERSASGFVIKLNKKLDADVTFSWTAVQTSTVLDTIKSEKEDSYVTPTVTFTVSPTMAEVIQSSDE